ncbi:hypothetical protein [Haloarcula sp. 1CSR25-25]|jgi:hypothetical protein|uniref:hypothetical protein n=1 Tax=Haloarcula sp. 1CSR25-25 TaxID=2862545 RepID=UPI002895B56D|nr:hypothetical protein [Haloarcula sp. 1CSR25-25]MDT3437878.1 hypothetical protein [Haloarcula sp. 1CSR25-25]
MTRPPKRPDDLIDADAFENPTGWDYGTVVHTGGGIYNRIWKQQRGETTIEVAYDPKKPSGASAGLYDSNREWLGVIKTLELDIQDPDEQDVLDLAIKLMKAINHGVYEDRIENLSP